MLKVLWKKCRGGERSVILSTSAHLLPPNSKSILSPQPHHHDHQLGAAGLFLLPPPLPLLWEWCQLLRGGRKSLTCFLQQLCLAALPQDAGKQEKQAIRGAFPPGVLKMCTLGDPACFLEMLFPGSVFCASPAHFKSCWRLSWILFWSSEYTINTCINFAAWHLTEVWEHLRKTTVQNNNINHLQLNISFPKIWRI